MNSEPGVYGLLILAASAVCATSCGSSDEVPVYPVRGQVLVQGQSAENAYIVCYPQGASVEVQQLTPRGKTTADGRFSLKTYRQGDGAPPGDYKISIVWHPPPEGMRTDQLHPSELTALPDRLEGRFADPATSGLTVTVTSGQNELPPFEIE